MRGVNREKFWENLWHGGPDCPWPNGRMWHRLIGFRGDPVPRHSRFYLADSLGPIVRHGGWLFAQAGGVAVAIRPVRAGCHEDPRVAWVPGRVFVCERWDDVLLLEVGQTADFGGFTRFRQAVLAAPLSHDGIRVGFTSPAGERLSFCWQEDGDPTVHGRVPDYGTWRFRDPCVRSGAGSGVIEIAGQNGRCRLHAQAPDCLWREEPAPPLPRRHECPSPREEPPRVPKAQPLPGPDATTVPSRPPAALPAPGASLPLRPGLRAGCQAFRC